MILLKPQPIKDFSEWPSLSHQFLSAVRLSPFSFGRLDIRVVSHATATVGLSVQQRGGTPPNPPVLTRQPPPAVYHRPAQHGVGLPSEDSRVDDEARLVDDEGDAVSGAADHLRLSAALVSRRTGSRHLPAGENNGVRNRCVSDRARNQADSVAKPLSFVIISGQCSYVFSRLVILKRLISLLPTARKGQFTCCSTHSGRLIPRYGNNYGANSNFFFFFFEPIRTYANNGQANQTRSEIANS